MTKLCIDYIEADNCDIVSNVHASTDDSTLLVTGPVVVGKTLIARAMCGDFLSERMGFCEGEMSIGQFRMALPYDGDRAVRKMGPIAFLPQNANSHFLTPTVYDETFLSCACGNSTADLTHKGPHASGYRLCGLGAIG